MRLQYCTFHSHVHSSVKYLSVPYMFYIFTEHTKTCVCMFHCKSMYITMSPYVQCSAVHSMLIVHLTIFLLFVYVLWFFSFLMVQKVESVYWLENTCITYVVAH